MRPTTILALQLTVCALAAASAQSPAPSLTIGLSFTSTKEADKHTKAEAPDVGGAVGPRYVVEFINGDFKAYDKQSGKQMFAQTAEAFWDAALGTSSRNAVVYDPHMVYDAIGKRWYASAQRPSTKGDMAVPLARSDTDDPTRGWKAVDLVLEADQKAGSWGDFDQIGFTPDAIGLSINVFQNGDDGRPRPNGYAIYVIKRADLDRTPPVLTVDRHYALKDARFAVAPVNDHEGRLKGPAFLANSSRRSEAADVLLRLDMIRKEDAWTFERRVTEIGEAPGQTLAKNQLAPMQVSQPDGASAFTQVSQPSTVQLVNGEFWFVQTVAHPADRTRTAVRWARIRESDNHVLGDGVIADPVLSLLQPSIAADKAGRVVIGCGGTSPQHKLSAYAIAGRAAGDRVAFGTITMVKEGSGVHAASGRWGDYTTTVADPSGNGRFWTFIPYAQSDGTWATQITEVIVGG